MKYLLYILLLWPALCIAQRQAPPSVIAGQVAKDSAQNAGIALLQTGKLDLSIYTSYTATVASALASKQATLVSGTNIKTINGTSLLGSGDIVISGGGAATTDASSLTTGTLPDARLSNVGTAGTLGGSGQIIESVTRDAKGRVTGITTITTPTGGSSTPTYSTTALTRAELQRALDASTSSSRVTLMPGVYPFNGTTVTFGGKNNVTITGQNSVTFVVGETDRLLLNGSTNSLTIEGIVFSSTATTGNTTATRQGLLDLNEQGIHTDLTVRNCYFTAPNVLRNGISTNTYSATADQGSGQIGGITRMKTQNCKFISLGGMGEEDLNHSWSDGRTDVLINDKEVSGCEFFDTGRIPEKDGTTYNGMAYSVSGRSQNVRFINNNVRDAKTYGIEFVGVDNGIIEGNTVNYTNNTFVGISIADGYGNGATATKNITIANNGVRSKTRPINMRGTTNANLSNNTFVADLIDNSNASSVYFQKCTGITLSGGSVFVNSWNPIRLDDCSDMVINPGRVTSLQTNNYASISIFGGSGYAGAGSANVRVGVNGGVFKKSNGVTTTAGSIYEVAGAVTGVTTF